MIALKLTALLCLISAFEIVFINAFRSDYTHIESENAYYKYHTNKALWPDARSMCEKEGAILFHPETEAELRKVLSALAIGNDGWINTGITDFEITEVYKTVDGRSINQVYNKWQQGSPACNSSPNICHCGYLYLYNGNHKIAMDPCTYTRRFICKHYLVKEVVMTKTEKTKNEIEQQLANQTVTIEILEREAESMKLLAANQSAVMDVLMREAASTKLQSAQQAAALEVVQQELEAMKKAQNQPSALERIADAIAKQTAATQQLIEANKLQDANQTAVMERQALALEKIANFLDTNEQHQ